MTTEFIDVIDSAVKIGLGALISGVSTYVITHKNHSNEKRKEYRDKRINTLEYAVENIEPYFHAFQSCLDIADGALRQDIPPGKIEADLYDNWAFEGDDQKLISARDKKNIALSRLKLIGLDKLHKILLQLLVVEKRFRTQLYINRELPSNDELDWYCNNYYSCRNEFYAVLQKEFERIYS